MQGIAPVKLSEYLLCGLPVIGTAAIGDTTAVVEQGLFLDDSDGRAEAAKWLVEEIMPRRDSYRERARAAGQAQFSLARSVEDYVRALEPLRQQIELAKGTAATAQVSR
jgi:glycosyltransferase involved in cell wall biosynthesis